MCLPVIPFKIEEEFVSSGLKCAVIQAREYQHRCGYVRIPPTHVLYSKDYSDIIVDVHGGLTFSKLESCVEEDGIGYWVGFDCAHCNDAMYDPDAPEGFFISRYHNNLAHQTYKSFDYVKQQTKSLARQIAEYAEVA